MQKKKHWNQSTCKHIDAKSWQFKTRQHFRLPILEFTNPNYSETSKLVYLKPDHDTHRTRQHLRQCFLSGFCNLTLFQGVISADLKRFSCICPERLNVFLIALDHTISQLSTDPICRWIVTKVCILNPRPGNETAGQGVKHNLMASKCSINIEKRTQKVTELRLPGGGGIGYMSHILGRSPLNGNFYAQNVHTKYVHTNLQCV